MAIRGFFSKGSVVVTDPIESMAGRVLPVYVADDAVDVVQADRDAILDVVFDAGGRAR